MRTYQFIAFALAALIATTPNASSQNRIDHIIPEKTWMNVPLGDSEINIKITHTWDEVHVWFYSYSRRPDKVFKKIKGLDSTDSNRTLIYKNGTYRIYFVDTIAGLEKVKIAVIKD